MPQQDKSKNIVYGDITAGGHVIIGDTTYINNYFAAREVIIPHRLTNNIPTNADHILGRATELAQAKSHLEQHQATVVFNGIGGIGKTALATKYMALNGSAYKHLVWITVQSTLAEAFTNNAPLLASLQITQQVQDYISAKQLDKAFEYLFHQLNLLEPTLVVIDNANDLDDLEQYKNWFDTATCHFLITSRNQPAEWATVEVDSLPEDEAVALFRKIHPTESADDEAIKNLLSKLFYHTLLIELVAKAGAIAGIPFADLQNMIETQFIHHESLNEMPLPTGKHGSVVPSNLKKARIEDYIWLIFSQVKGLDEDSTQLLKAMALLPVATPFDLDFLKEHFAFFNIPDTVVHLDSLTERGWLQKEQVEGERLYFKMHPLIADVVVGHLEVDVKFAENFIAIVASWIFYENTNTEHDLFEKNKKKTYADRLSDLFFEENTESMSCLLGNLGYLEQNFAFYGKALKYKERALAIGEKIFAKNDVRISLLQSNLANIFSYLGKYEYAVKLLESSLENDIEIFGKDSIKLTVRQSNLAGFYKNLGKYDRARELLEAVVKNVIENLGVTHPDVASYESNLSNIYINLQMYAQARELLERALASDIRNFGYMHPNVAVRQSNLGLVYQYLGDYNKSLELLEAALESDLKNFGENHPNVSRCQNNLGQTHKKIGNYKEAESLFEKAIGSIVKNLGSDHVEVAKSQWNLAALYAMTERKNEAKRLLNIVYENFLINLGDQHLLTLNVRKWISKLDNVSEIENSDLNSKY